MMYYVLMSFYIFVSNISDHTTLTLFPTLIRRGVGSPIFKIIFLDLDDHEIRWFLDLVEVMCVLLYYDRVW